MVLKPVVLAALLLATAGRASAPAFDRYPAKTVRAARHAAPRIADPLSRQYRSALREAAAHPVDFAGDQVLAQIGCGAGCIRLAAIDRASGRVTWFPSTVSGWPLEVTEPLTYRRTSRLLIVQGQLDEQGPVATRAFVFDGRRFTPVQP